MDELLPCPSCKSKDIAVEGIDLDDPESTWWVECRNCGHKGPKTDGIRKAKLYWNNPEIEE